MTRGFSSIILIILAAAVIGLAITASVFMSKSSPSQNSPASVTKPTEQLTAEPTVSKIPEVKSYPGTKEFTSQNLKIAFNYLPQAEGVDINVKEIGNRVYVSLGNTKIEQGQYVEVFPKDKNDSLNEAVKKKFLAGKSDKDCFVVASPSTFTNYPENYQAVEISFPKPTDEQIPWWELGDKCSPGYSQSNGKSYFLGDSQHPNEFLFLSIGQYGISAGSNLSWQDTIHFLN